jgi:anti-sigma B factor antagonist
MATNPVPVSELGVTTDSTPTEIIAHCTGKITSNTIQSLKATVKPLFSESKPVVLDLTNVSYLDSSGLGAIVGLYVSAKTAKSQLRLINLNKHLKELFSITRLGQFMAEGRDPNDLVLPWSSGRQRDRVDQSSADYRNPLGNVVPKQLQFGSTVLARLHNGREVEAKLTQIVDSVAGRKVHIQFGVFALIVEEVQIVREVRRWPLRITLTQKDIGYHPTARIAGRPTTMEQKMIVKKTDACSGTE